MAKARMTGSSFLQSGACVSLRTFSLSECLKN